MPVDPIRVLIAEDNPFQLEMLRESLSGQDDIEIAGTASNGMVALDMIRDLHPQVLVCDLVMPLMDGFALIDKLSGENRPLIIALSMLGREDFVKRAIQMGVNDYLIKPTNGAVLADRIRSLVRNGTGKQPAASPAAQETAKPEKAAPATAKLVTSLLMQLGVPANLTGYSYLHAAIIIAVDSPEVVHQLTQALYPVIAEQFQTTSSSVERAIRHAVTSAWDRGAAEAYHRLLGRTGPMMHDKPTNRELIAQLAERVRIKHA